MSSFILIFKTVLLSLLISNTANAISLDMTCIGDPNAKTQAIFLHGFLTETKDKVLQPDYTHQLGQVAKKANLRIAMPISKDPCRGDANKRCWSGNDSKEIAEIWTDVMTASARCIDIKKPFGLIGHSNGGYMTGRIIMRCLKPQPKWAVAAGAAGDISHTQGVDTNDCTTLTVFIGKKDLTNQKAKKFVEQLKAKKRKATLVEYNGVHDFEMKSLLDLIAGLEKAK